MNKQSVWLEAQPRNFALTPNGIRWEAVIFSSEFNRNKAFFDILKMKRWDSKLSKIQLNNNHDGKYFSAITDKIVELKIETGSNGVTEAYAIIESNNPGKLDSPEIVTGFSIELLVDAKDVIANENGEYYIDYEWVGMAYLTGELAGSGDSRLLSMKTFAQNNTNSMSDNNTQLILTKLEEFNTKADLILEKFHTVMAEEKEAEEAQEPIKGAEDNPNTESITEPSDVSDTAPVTQEPTPEIEPTEPVLEQVEAQLKARELHLIKMQSIRTTEQLINPSGVVEAAKTKDHSAKFLLGFRK